MIINQIKQTIRKSFLYPYFNYFNSLRQLKNWTKNDTQWSNFYSKFITPGDLVFDIGANIGIFVKIFLKLNTRVIAVEPQYNCIKILEKAFPLHKDNLTIIPKAVGEQEGKAELWISDSNTLSSLSRDWIETVQRSGRFSNHIWDKKQIVNLTTIDKLISEFGMPAFIKIDVEGYELSVVKGLSKAVKILSLEFTPEFILSTFNCIDYLNKLGEIVMNIAFGPSFRFDEWISPSQMKTYLASLRNHHKLFADIYISFNINKSIR